MYNCHLVTTSSGRLSSLEAKIDDFLYQWTVGSNMLGTFGSFPIQLAWSRSAWQNLPAWESNFGSLELERKLIDKIIYSYVAFICYSGLF
jgi:hypothetical protein